MASGWRLAALRLRQSPYAGTIEDQSLRLMRVLFKVVAVVNWAHARRYVHLDLSLNNILVDQYDAVAVIDWPHIRLTSADRNTFEPLPAGFRYTRDHLEPEAASAATGGYSDDIHALGVCMRLLSGSVSDTELATICPRLRSFIDQATDRRPEHRQSAAQFLKGDLFAPERDAHQLAVEEVCSEAALARIVALRGENQRRHQARFRRPNRWHLHDPYQVLTGFVRKALACRGCPISH